MLFSANIAMAKNKRFCPLNILLMGIICFIPRAFVFFVKKEREGGGRERGREVEIDIQTDRQRQRQRHTGRQKD